MIRSSEQELQSVRPRRQLDHSLRLEIHEVQVLFVDGNVITGFWRIDIDQEVDVTNERHPLRILNAIWHAVSSDDSHKTKGSYEFTVKP
jgi:hypothetical protein